MQDWQLLVRDTLLTRLFIAALITLASATLTHFDNSAALILPKGSSPLTYALLRWDVFQYLRIASNDYTYEHDFAFFPGIPALSMFFTKNTSSIVHVGGLWSVVADVLSINALYRLTRTVFGTSSRFAYMTAMLALVPPNVPALRFAGYAEPTFNWLSYEGRSLSRSSSVYHTLTLLIGMIAAASGRYSLAAIFFFFASAFRSNGLILPIFIVWPIVVEPFLRDKRVSQSFCIHHLPPYHLTVSRFR